MHLVRVLFLLRRFYKYKRFIKNIHSRTTVVVAKGHNNHRRVPAKPVILYEVRLAGFAYYYISRYESRFCHAEFGKNSLVLTIFHTDDSKQKLRVNNEGKVSLVKNLCCAKSISK